MEIDDTATGDEAPTTTVGPRGMLLVGALLLVLVAVLLLTRGTAGHLVRVTGTVQSPHLSTGPGKYAGVTWSYDVVTSDPANPLVHVDHESRIGALHAGDTVTVTVDPQDPSQAVS